VSTPATPGIQTVPVRTPTLPPATHTNTYVVGEGAMSVFDPASPWEDEQRRLAALLQERIAAGEQVERIVLTHHHHDHVSGAEALRAALGADVPIAAHPVTASLVQGQIRVDESLVHGDILMCGGRTLHVHFTPGHAPGHLVFVDGGSGAVIAGDMVAGVGTIAIDPREGNLADYLASLEAMRHMGATVLLPSHGPPLAPPEAVLSMYIAHRHGRTDQIRRALDEGGASTPRDLVPEVYPDLPAAIAPLAAMQITAHLVWLVERGLAVEHDGRWQLTR
jgi:ribonuclease/clavin/mitogillin